MNEVIGAMGNGGAVRGGRVIIYFALLPTSVPYILYSTPIYILLVGEVEDGVIGRAIGAITHPTLPQWARRGKYLKNLQKLMSLLLEVK